MTQSYDIRFSTSKDKKQILCLLNQVFQNQQRFDWIRDEDFWSWKYESNVFGKPIIHVIEHNGKVVGSGTLWPWKFISRGEVFNVYQPCDTTIDLAYQGKGLFSLLNRHRLPIIGDMDVPFVFNFPNTNSLPGYLKFNWRYLAKMPWMLKVLNPIGTFRLLQSKEKSAPFEIAKEDIVDPSNCELVSETNDQVYFSNLISTYREKGFFSWRYSKHPFFKYGQVIVEQGKKKTGAIFSIYNKGNSREMVVVDIFGNPNLTSLLFNQIQEKAKSYQVDYIACLYNRHFNMNVLWKKGYFKVKNKNMVVLPFDLRLENQLTNYRNWNMIAAMHDAI